jgi:hypothetical protein
MDDSDLDALERELPNLTRLSRFARSLNHLPWFANLGEKLTLGAAAAARAYADGLGFPEADIAILPDWVDALAAAETSDWNGPAWEAEELLRADVTARALDIVSEEALTIAMTMIADQVAQCAGPAAREAASIWDIDEEEAVRLAVGGAGQAAHQAALALVAAADPDFDADGHPFAAKFQLFEFGRWPVGVSGRSINLF